VIQVFAATIVYAQTKEEEIHVQELSMQAQIVVQLHVKRVHVV
jgi:hypothetical protein